MTRDYEYDKALYTKRKAEIIKYHNDACSRCGNSYKRYECHPSMKKLIAMSAHAFGNALKNTVLLCGNCKADIFSTALHNELERLRNA